jgi:hypothetical protein
MLSLHRDTAELGKSLHNTEMVFANEMMGDRLLI